MHRAPVWSQGSLWSQTEESTGLLCTRRPCCQSGKRSSGSSAIADDHTCHLTGVCWNLWKAFPAKPPPAAEKNGGCLESWHLLQHCRHICLVESDLKNDMSNRDLNKLICSRSSLYSCLRIDEKRTNNINNGSLFTEWPCLFQYVDSPFSYIARCPGKQGTTALLEPVPNWGSTSILVAWISTSLPKNIKTEAFSGYSVSVAID